MWDACRKISRSDTRVSLVRFGSALQQSAIGPIFMGQLKMGLTGQNCIWSRQVVPKRRQGITTPRREAQFAEDLHELELSFDHII